MYNKENIFARIIRKELPAEIIFEDEDVIAIQDINPAAPVHILVMPKGEYSSFDDFIQNAPAFIVQRLYHSVREVAHQFGLYESGYRIIMNHGPDAMQSVGHYHIHVIGGRELGPLVVGDEYHK